MKHKPLILGVAGGSGSGKTTFIRLLQEQLGSNLCTVISQDDYYRPIEEQECDENGEINFDLPSAIDSKKLFEDLEQLCSGRKVEINRYTFNNEDDQSNRIQLQPNKVIVVEGLFVLHYPELQKRFNLTVFVDAPDEVRFERRLRRDKEERGYPENVVRYQWENHVVPAYEQFLEPYRPDANHCVNNSVDMTVQVEALCTSIKERIAIQELS